ncbi:MAG TPA: hypothetical protein VFH78_05970 [Candidatus Thermoplasmatota archaeon]|nr:hypothetical protein [Candidatus Thermoplasmatota archaeon]
MRLRIPSLALDLPRLDGQPRRSLACVNMRHEEKALLDLLQAWWSARSTRPLTQADVMSLLLALALEHPRADVPPGLERDE